MNGVTQFLGGSPLSVLIRLVILSVVVGFILAWLDIRPMELVDWIVGLFEWAWTSIFGSLNRAVDYFLLGAVIVVPLFLLSRLLKTANRG
ncbi:DUF6460 domain-containing protein [Antarcticirhabdus aurantiaca]|uniref:DUF6460 domain-containing protein n=1 Tax=Antarcticirhabdus aurantiaca TaxID=2606717 RepID=A0ACD4NTX9_9HYPH|nr:DUF6460 domain-containing protein [Antarcticirhabdus aurantiaca]WAJ30376.1 DUF6460 domain-containing protein [Jeongeuplla avenae]